MESAILSDANDLQAMRDLIQRLSSNSTVVDFEENILLPSVRATTRLWKQDNALLGFAYVDNYNNLWFDLEADLALADALEVEMIEWGAACIKRRSAETGESHSLDCTCRADNHRRRQVLERYGFVREPVRSLHYSRSLQSPISAYPLPAGFSMRCVTGRDKVEQLVTLHRAAFGTDNMTVEERLAMMSAPHYVPELDLVAVAPNGELAAFCVCGFDDPDRKMGYTDPIGTHPSYQRSGLGKALVSAGLIALKNAGADTARLGTSSENSAMQKLAGELGYVCVAEQLWFSKVIS